MSSKMNQRMKYADAIRRSVTRAVQIAQPITQVAAFTARGKQQRSLPMLFQPFQPSLMWVEKVEQPKQPKVVFCQKNTKPTQST